jgi:hypothetical protein
MNGSTPRTSKCEDAPKIYDAAILPSLYTVQNHLSLEITE